MAAPPVLVGAVKATDTCALPGVATKAVGASDVVAGVTVVVEDAVPEPAEFTARNLTL